MIRRGANIILFLCLALSGTAYGQDGGWTQGEHVRVRLVAGVSGMGQLARIPLGLDVALESGWKTYWRMPGDAGAPPQWDWSASRNLDKAQMDYPVPERHIDVGLETLGYTGHVVFPLLAVPKIPGEAMEIAAKLALLTCAETCIPNDFVLHLTIPAGAADPSPEAGLLTEWQARVPRKGTPDFFMRFDGFDDKGAAILHFAGPGALRNPAAFVESSLNFDVPKIALDGNKRQGTILLPPRGDAKLAGGTATVTLADNGQGWEHDVVLGASPAPMAEKPPAAAPDEHHAPSLLLMLLFAFIGGMILNLMPCVLPVLSLKILKFMGHGGRDDRAARRSFLASAAGIMVSFVIMAVAVIALRAAGQTVGWGMQFQQPAFLAFLILVLLLFAANLWGWFEIQLPSAINDKLFGAGRHKKLWGDFLTGMFATLLATPCSAPFLGTAVGFALASGPFETLLIFTGLGGGMMLPYLLVATRPGLATRMPRPGAWMARLKRILALALLATAVWIGHVLWLQNTADKTATSWQAFDPAAIPALAANGNTVFVDVTAAWCITCQVNKKLVLDRAPVTERLFGSDIVAMQADWTRPDPVIAAYLKSFGRGGIPFNVVYGPGAPEGIPLPELLSEDAVMKALDKAATKP